MLAIGNNAPAVDLPAGVITAQQPVAYLLGAPVKCEGWKTAALYPTGDIGDGPARRNAPSRAGVAHAPAIARRERTATPE